MGYANFNFFVYFSVLWTDLSSKLVWLVFGVTICFGLIGAFDDYKKLKNNSSEGIKSGLRLVLEFGVSFLFIYFINHIVNSEYKNIVFIPFTKDYILT